MKYGRLTRQTLTCLALVAVSNSFAGPTVNNGIRFVVSPQGLDYFKNHLPEFLKSKGIDLSKQTLKDIEFEINDPFSSQSLPASTQAAKKFDIEMIDRKLGQFFTGFSLGKPIFKTTISGANYEAVFKTLSLEFDPKGLQNYGLTRGAVGIIRAESANFCIMAPKLRAQDKKKPKMLGVIGGDALWVAHANAGCNSKRNATNKKQVMIPQGSDSARPLKIEVPVHLDVSSGSLVIKPLAIKTNLQLVGLMADYKSLLLPKISLMINGVEYPLDKSEIDDMVKDVIPNLLSIVGSAAKSYVEKDLKAVLAEKLAKVGKQANLEFKMTLPGAPGSAEPITMAVTPAAVDYTNGRFQLVLHTELKDPTTQANFATPGSASAPVFAHAPASYDLAFVLHPGILNGILQRTYDRKFLSEFDIGDNTKVQVSKAPYFTFATSATTNPKADRGRLRVAITYEVTSEADGGLANTVVKKPIPIEFDLITRLEVVNRNEIDLVMDSIDLDSVKVTTQNVTLLGLFQKKIRKTVMKKMEKANQGFKDARKTLGAIPTPDDVLGLPLRLKEARTDNGGIVLYNVFDELPLN